MRDVTNSTLPLNQLDARLEWSLERYAELRRLKREGKTMQDQITIELRVDFEDKDKLEQVKQIACNMARTLVANVQLLGPACKPECAIFTDNFMSPAEKIDIYSDLIGAGQKQLAAAAGNTAVVTHASQPDEQISDELLATLRGG